MGMFLQILIGLGVAAISAIGGYILHQYRNRARPYIVLRGFSGSIFESHYEIVVGVDLKQRTSDSFVCPELGDKPELSDIMEVFKDANRFNDAAPELISRLENAQVLLEKAKDELEIIDAISPPLALREFDRSLMIALSKGTITIPNINTSIHEKIKCFDHEDRGGSLCFGFPKDPLFFGAGFKAAPILRDRALPFIAAVKRLDKKALLHIFREFHTLVKKELEICEKVAPEVEKIIDAHSKWECQLYAANYGAIPMLILPEGTLYVRDRSLGSQFSEKCQLVKKEVVSVAEKTRTVKRDEENALLLKPGEEVEFLFITKKAQVQMDQGNVLREVYKNKRSLGRVVFFAVSRGPFRRKTIKTPWVTFKGD